MATNEMATNEMATNKMTKCLIKCLTQRLQRAQNFWVFSFHIADFWQTFWVIWKKGSNWSNLRLNKYHHGELGNSSTGSKLEGFDELGSELLKNSVKITLWFWRNILKGWEMVKCEVRFGLYLAARPKQSSLLLIYMSVSLNKLTLKKCARILGHHLELNYYSDKLISTLTLPRQSELKFAGWGLCFVHLLYFRVSTSDRPCAHQRSTLCPPTSDLVSTSEPPVSHKLRNFKTKVVV